MGVIEMRNLLLPLAVVLLTACASKPPAMGPDIGACQVPALIIFKSDAQRQLVCTPGDTDTWRQFTVHYDASSQYSSSTLESKGDFYAPPGQECADMPTGYLPRAVDSCRRHGH